MPPPPAPGGVLLLRTNGACRAHRERADWRVYDRRSLTQALQNAGFAPLRITHAAFMPSLWDVARGAVPTAPQAGDAERDGVPDAVSASRNRLAGAISSLESRWLAVGRDVPFGHTLFALARA